MIKIFQDNGRLIIMIENDDNIDMKKFTSEITKKAMELAIPVEDTEVVGLQKIEPTPEDVEEMLSTSKEVISDEQKIINDIIKEKDNNEQSQKEEKQIIIEENTKEEVTETNTVLPEPKNIPNEDLIDENYKYSGQVPLQVIMSKNNIKEKDITVAELFINYSVIKNKKLKKILVEDMKEYINKRFEDMSQTKINNLTREEITETLLTYQPLVKNGVKAVLEQAGYIDLNSFLEESDDINLKSAYYNIINHLLKTIKK